MASDDNIQERIEILRSGDVKARKQAARWLRRRLGQEG
jgi:hypothetical protein